METIDGSQQPDMLRYLKSFQDDTTKALEKKGQLVKDHQTSDVLSKHFMIKLMGKSIFTPSSSPLGALFAAIIGKDNLFPNAKVVDDHFKFIHITQVPKPYLPCTISENQLKSMRIVQMKLETHHRKRKVLVRVVSCPDRTDSVNVIVEDEDGTAAMLQLFQQLPENILPCAENILNYTVCIIKEPYFKQSFDSPSGGIMTPSTYYSLRIDHPNDIICLKVGDERIPEKWRGNEGCTDGLEQQNESSKGYQDDGNKSFHKKQWVLAQYSYSKALDIAKSSEEEQLARLNRSMTNLKLNRPARALQDITQAYNPEKPTEMALFRHATALYHLGKFEEYETRIQTLLEAFPDSKMGKLGLELAKARLHEQKTGKYDFKKMYEQAKAKTPPLIDCATFSSPVEIRDSPGRGRGLFTTKAVSAGDLLLCEKAFSYSFIDDTRLTDEATWMVNLTTKQMTAGASANLWPQVVQKLYHDSEALALFQELYHGEYKKATVSECDGAPVVDAFLVEKILSLNSFGCPRTSRDFFEKHVFSGKNEYTTRERPLFTIAGVWLIASRINHSCIGNCQRSFIGDMLIIRAAQDIPANTELVFSYRATTHSESLQDYQKKLAKWNFVCSCELCKDRSKTTDTVRKQRKDLYDDFMDQIPSDEPMDFAKAIRLMRVVEKTYRGKPAKKVRWVLAELYAYIGIRCRQDEDFVNAAEMLIKALEAMGFVIYATPPGDTTAEPRFEVKHWGLVEHFVPWLFFQLVDCYGVINSELLWAAEHYAKVAYSIIIGEHESMWDILPSTGKEKK
ncbi:TPR domain-containing protein [Fusarium heterosporum]|uniref:TPR domain-containing protein n=1 Tax=Fusarium heterosporum TaxID=42747 RepID=A0A8H5TQV5_FUSHE|nr:TPR domain-containing protein [Fusarium heterosporum]